MNLQKMLQQAQELQTRIADIQTKLEAQETEGASGGGMVKATINGKGYALKLQVDAKLVDPAEKDMMEDLIVAAFNDARAKMESNFSEEMGKLTAGMPLPPGFKVPF